MGVVIEDNSDRWLAKVTASAEAGLDRAAIYTEQQVRESLNSTQGGVVPGTGGDTGTRGRYIPSPPGTPPGTRTGRLRNSITHGRAGKLRRVVGTNVRYARIHELGGVINHPGGTPYIVLGSGQVAFVSKNTAKKRAAKGLQTKRTRAHPITMPRRPYLVPGLQRAASSGQLQKHFDAGFKRAMGGAG